MGITVNLNRKAAENGLASAQHRLGHCYYYGQGVIQDYSQSVFWFRKAAEQENVTAQFNLGLCYQNGNGVIKDLSQAAFWFQKAAKNGDEEAKHNLKYCSQNIENAKTNKNTEKQLNRKQESKAKTGFHLQNCVTIIFLYLLYTIYVSTGFLNGIGMLVVNIIVAFPSVLFIFAVEDSDNA